MNHVFKAIGSAVVVSALAACGGGDDSGTSPKYKENDVRNTATLGVVTIGFTGDRVAPALTALGGILQELSTNTGGSLTSPVTACGGAGSGTFTVALVKSAVRTGLAVGDQASYTFVNCTFSGTTVTLNGSATTTLQSNAVNLNSATYQVSYAAGFTSFSMKFGALTTTLTGTVNGVSSLTSSNTSSDSFTVPAGQSLSAVITGGASGAYTMAYSAGTTFSGGDVTSPNSATRKLDGSVTSTAGGGSVPLTITTPVTLGGTVNPSSGQFTATSGVLNTKSSDLATSVSFNGAVAAVSGDSDGNGSLDLTFQSSWAGLTSGQ